MGSFDTIPHERLLALVQQRVADGRVLALVESFLRAGVLEESKRWRPTACGTPQGGVISPLLANLYLNPPDHQMAAAGWERGDSAPPQNNPCAGFTLRPDEFKKRAIALLVEVRVRAGVTPFFFRLVILLRASAASRRR